MANVKDPQNPLSANLSVDEILTSGAAAKTGKPNPAAVQGKKGAAEPYEHKSDKSEFGFNFSMAALYRQWIEENQRQQQQEDSSQEMLALIKRLGVDNTTGTEQPGITIDSDEDMDTAVRRHIDTSMNNFSRLADILKSSSIDVSAGAGGTHSASRTYNFSSGRPSFEGFNPSEFKRQGNAANWSKFDFESLPKVGSVKNVKLDGSFEQAFKIVLASEGGFANHKADRGGATIFGIASKANPREYQAIMECLDRGDQNGAMKITMDTYKTKYWDRAGIDAIKDPAARLVAFDAAINHGAGYASKMVARTHDADEMLRIRATTYRSIIENDPSQQAFSKGWNNRLAKLDTITDNNPGTSGTTVVAAAAPTRTNKGPEPVPA